MTDRRFPYAALLVALLLFPACGGGGDAPPPVQFNTEAALLVMQLLSPRPDAEVELELTANSIVAATGVLVSQKNVSVPPKVPPFALTEIGHYGVLEQFLTNAQLQNLFGVSEVQQGSPLNPTFPTGVGQEGAFTVQANDSALLEEGDYYFFYLACKAPLPFPTSPDPTLLYQFAFTMDQDGDTGNNFTTTDNDFFNDTDRWYELTYSNGAGWRLFVWDWDDDAEEKVEITSAARAIFGFNALVLVVPKSEFALANPGYRVSTFCHDGDFGIPFPHSWSGDLHPTVAEGLQPFPVPGD